MIGQAEIDLLFFSKKQCLPPVCRNHLKLYDEDPSSKATLAQPGTCVVR